MELLVIDNQKAKNNLNTIIAKLGNLSAVSTVTEKPNGAFNFMNCMEHTLLAILDKTILVEKSINRPDFLEFSMQYSYSPPILSGFWDESKIA